MTIGLLCASVIVLLLFNGELKNSLQVFVAAVSVNILVLPALPVGVAASPLALPCSGSLSLALANSIQDSVLLLRSYDVLRFLYSPLFCQ